MTRKMVPHNEQFASLIFKQVTSSSKKIFRIFLTTSAVFAYLAPFNIFVTKMESTCLVNLCLLQIPLDNNPPGRREHLSSPLLTLQNEHNKLAPQTDVSPYLVTLIFPISIEPKMHAKNVSKSMQGVRQMKLLFTKLKY